MSISVSLDVPNGKVLKLERKRQQLEDLQPLWICHCKHKFTCLPTFLYKTIFFFFFDYNIYLCEYVNRRNAIPPTTTVENLRVKQKASTGKICVDVGFWGGIIPGNAFELVKLAEEGVIGFKCFLHPSGDEAFPYVTEEDVELACKQLNGLDVLVAV